MAAMRMGDKVCIWWCCVESVAKGGSTVNSNSAGVTVLFRSSTAPVTFLGLSRQQEER